MLNGIDGIVENNHLLLIGTTNQLDSIDKALLRSERFGFHIYFPLPELSERVEFFERFGKKNAIWEPSLTARACIKNRRVFWCGYYRADWYR